MAPKVGDPLPDVTLYEGSPQGAVKLRELFAGKRGVIVGVVAAFAPMCSLTHLPSYLYYHQQLKDAGADVIVAVAVNDPFVMEAWGEHLAIGGKLRMLADTCCEFNKAVGLTYDATGLLGNVRSQRYSLVIDDNVIRKVNVEDDPMEVIRTLADPVADFLRAL